jgi:hypothetical protein
VKGRSDFRFPAFQPANGVSLKRGLRRPLFHRFSFLFENIIAVLSAKVNRFFKPKSEGTGYF